MVFAKKKKKKQGSWGRGFSKGTGSLTHKHLGHPGAFSVKGQRGNILFFVGQMVSATTALLSSTKASVDNT